MRKLWPSSIGSLWVLGCLSACSDSGPGAAPTPAAGSGGKDAPDASATYQGDAAIVSLDAGVTTGILDDVAPAQCRPDPTDFAPCGGDVTGKWRAASFCLQSSVDDLREEWGCQELTQDFSYEYRMLVEFRNNGNYSAAVEAEARQTVLLPASCLPEATDCHTLLGEDDIDESDNATLRITTVDEGCSIAAREWDLATEAGIWMVADHVLTMTNSTGPSSTEYCVKGDVLTVKDVNENTGHVRWGVFERL